MAALVALSSMDTEAMDPWIAGPGKTSMSHSGLVVYAHVSLKIMVACDEEPRRNRRALKLVFGEACATRIPNPAIFERGWKKAD